MFTPHHIIAIVALAAVAIAPSADAQLSNDYFHAQALLDEVAQAEGADMFAALTTAQFTIVSELTNARQGYEPSIDPTRMKGEPFVRYWFFDFERDSFRELYSLTGLGGFRGHFETLQVDGQRYAIMTTPREYTVGPDSFERVVSPRIPWIPGLLLAQAIRQRSSATIIHTEANEHELAFEFTSDQGTRYRMIVNDETKLISSVEWLGPDFLLGDATIKIRFEGRHEIDGLRLPDRAMFTRSGEIIGSHRYVSARSDPQFEPAVFMLDKDLKPFNGTGVRNELSIEHVAGSVWEIVGLSDGLYRQQFIEFPSYVVLFDAVLFPGVGMQVKRMIDEHTGGKPIRSVILSHYHSDHIGAISVFARGGSTVLTSPSSALIVSRAIRFPGSKLLGAPPSRAEAGELLQLVEPVEPLVLQEGDVEVHVHYIGATPHVSEMLLAYLPRENLVINGDLFSNLVPYAEQFDVLGAWSQDAGAGDPLIAGVHHEPMQLSRIDAHRRVKEAFVPAYLRPWLIENE